MLTDRTRPDFFLVGAPKSGTTALYEYLRQHPELYLPERKELRYFGRDLEIRDRPQLTLDEYLDHFSGAPPGSQIGTAYVWYLYSRSAAAEIKAFNPEARIIAMLRNPVDMLPALHGEHLTNGNEDIEDFTAALDAEPARREGRLIPEHAHLPQGLLYSEVARYAEQLKRYVDVFGREQMHVVLFDDFAKSPADAYRDTVGFLGVRDDIAPHTFAVVNPSRRLRSERLRHFLARPPDLPRRIISKLVPPAIRRPVYERAKRANVVVARRPPVPAETRSRVLEKYRDEIARLSEMLDRDLSGWAS